MSGAADILGVGVWGPGLQGWPASRAVLAGRADFVSVEMPVPALSLLAPTERRRAGAATRLALAVALEASEAAGIAPGTAGGVFATSNGDGAVVGALLEVLTSADPLVSPTQFHNSVHNAAAGYWSIGTQSAAPVTSLSGHDGSFAAALLRAVSEVVSDRVPVLLVAYDLPVPQPLAALRPTRFAFGVGLMLGPADGAAPSLARLTLGYRAGAAPAGEFLPRATGLHELAAANPAARSLRLLEALAAGRADRFALDLFAGQVMVEVAPCSAPNASAP
ncbi:MAG: beta-ketoacyl synthase chain length factor [Rhodospirillales bacterium]|nr:beta-ketoacyl synthase chain length factor [Rhodospirillales bacterium]